MRVGRARRWCAIAVCALAVVACTDEAADDEAASDTASADTSANTTTSTSPESLLERDTAVIEDYVEAINAGDIGIANSLRCEGGRIEAADQSVFADQVRRLTEQSGPIAVVSVEEAMIDIEPLDDGDDVAYYRVGLADDAPGSRSAVVLPVLGQDDERRLCGTLTEWAALRPADEVPELTDVGATTVTPEGIVPDVEIEGMTVVEDGPFPEDDAAATWTRAWQSGGYGGCRVSAQTGRREGAVPASEHLQQVLADGVEMWEAPGEPGVVGVRYLAYAWLWTQPPGSGPYIDFAMARAGDMIISASCANLPAGSDHAMTSDLITTALTNARG